MHDLLETLVSNIAVALVLALVAVLATGLRARPALVHGLWVLVLLKLVTPPIARVPVSIPQPVPTASSLIATVPPRSLPLARTPSRIPVPAPLAAAPAQGRDVPWVELLLSLWLLGSALCLASTARDWRRIKRLIRCSHPAPETLQGQVDDLARRLGLKRAPRVHLFPGKLSPMLWAAGGEPRLLIPQQLLPRLEPRARTSLLVHELAHLRRKDHWVRYLEVLVRSAHWWNPLVWFACRQLRIAEEECCDAWVLWALPRARRSYADALLSTVEFLNDSRAVLPAAASGIGRAQNLKRRLTMIMQGNTRRTLTRSGRAAILSIAALALPLLPVHGQGTGERERMEQELHQRHTHLNQLRHELEELKLHARELHQRGAQDRIHELEAHMVVLHDRLAAEESQAAELRAHLHLQDPLHRVTQDEHSKAVMNALREAIDALRDRDQDEEADVLAQLAEHLMRETEHEREMSEERDRAADMEARKAVEHAQRMADEIARARSVVEEKALLDRLLTDERDQHRVTVQHLIERDRADEELRSQLHRGNVDQNDQIRRLEARVDELAAMVKKLADLAEKQAAERRDRIR